MVRRRQRNSAILALVLVTAGASAGAGEQTPRFNDAPLGGLQGYAIVAVVAPGLVPLAGVTSSAMKARAEARLEKAGILKSEGKSPIASVFIIIRFMPPAGDVHGWHAAIEVRQRARLERAPESGTVMAVTWDQTVMGLTEKKNLGSELTEAVDGLVEALVGAHKRGGPATR